MSSQHKPVENNIKWVFSTFKHNLLAINQSKTICNSLCVTLNEVLREGLLNNTAVSSANKMKCNLDDTHTKSFI